MTPTELTDELEEIFEQDVLLGAAWDTESPANKAKLRAKFRALFELAAKELQ